MQRTRHRNNRVPADTTGWLLGSVIAVLAVLDLLIWAALWNVPNPISKWLTPQAVVSRPVQPVVWSADEDGEAQPAMLKGDASQALPRSRAQ